ncbi:zinc-dependent alcohol dehydrogenase family protein [Pendulispora albinea]|uniref:Zinc-dependent alcohol dehydrogenase family protein n=1 Tax=Pendulispora albinea TaxID=2741071 RepID=A0ABZ2M3Z0_9BACT
MTTTNRIIRFHEFGEPADVLRLEEDETPAGPLGAREVRVHLTSCAIHPSDLMNIRGRYGLVQPTLPRIPGTDAAGRIVEVGAEVSDLRPGDRVILLLGATRGEGTWREQVRVPAAAVVKMPDNLPEANAGSVWVNYLSVWIMVQELLAVPPGGLVLQTAAGSQLGRAMMEFARLRNFRLINAVRRREQVEELEALNGGPVLCTEDDDFVARVRELAGEGGLRYAIDAVAGATGAKLVEAMGVGGQIVLFGALERGPLPLPVGAVLFKEIAIRGFWLRRWTELAGPARHRALVDDILRHIAQGDIVPALDTAFPFAAFRDAVRRAETPGRKGAVVLVDGDSPIDSK